MFRMRFRSFRCVVRGVLQMTMSRMRVVCRRFVVTSLIMFCRFAMVFAGMFVMFRCLVVMLRRLL
jgi:hypothetical protein